MKGGLAVRIGIPTKALLSREQKLIGSILAADWSARSSRVWNTLAFENIEWKAIPLLAAQHKIRPMAAAALREAGWPGVPATVREQIVAAEIVCARNSLTQLSLLATVAEQARARGIRVLALKGPALSQHLYGNPLIRESFDLDFLVHPDDLTSMADILARENIFPFLTGPPLSRRQAGILRHFNKHNRFQHAESRIVVECHYRLDHNPLRLDTDFEDLWNRHRAVSVAGQVIGMPGQEDLTQYLCVHAAGHIWDRWKWIGDLTALCRLISGAELAEHREWANASGNLILFDASMLLMVAITGNPLPAELARKSNMNQLASAVAGRALRLVVNCPAGNDPPRQWYRLRQRVERLRLKPSWRCFWFEIAVLAHRPEDWHAWKLPDIMMWAYYPLRLVSFVRRAVRSKTTSKSG